MKPVGSLQLYICTDPNCGPDLDPSAGDVYFMSLLLSSAVLEAHRKAKFHVTWKKVNKLIQYLHHIPDCVLEIQVIISSSSRDPPLLPLPKAF